MTTTPEAPAKTLTQLVALEIRLEMVRQDVLQSKLARSIGKTEQWLSVRLRGKQPIDVNDLALIAHGLGVQVHQLLPDPDTAAKATLEPTVRYAQPVDGTTPATRRPADNRPPGHPIGRADSTDPASRTRRTVRVQRPGPNTRP